MPPSNGYADAVRQMADRVFCKSPKYQSMQRRARRDGAQQQIIDFEKRFIAKAKKLDIPLYCHNMVRTKLEQDGLFVTGVSKSKGGKSPHNFGCAADIIHCRFHWEMEPEAWAVLGHVGKEVAKQAGIDIEWGGDWKFYDPAHWQLNNWKQMVDA